MTRHTMFAADIDTTDDQIRRMRASVEAEKRGVIEARAEWDRVSMTSRGDRHDSAQRRYLRALESAASAARALDALLKAKP